MLLKPQAAIARFSIDADLVLVDNRTGEGYLLNQTAAEVWSLCDGLHSLREVAEIIADRYCVDPLEVVSDVETLATSFLASDLLAQDPDS